ncbi:NAD-binding protein [Streptomyces sp. AC512_CC834]|uniref:NAD-binding protein n=1 Tax=Streptomyces sp. AC512_CC834 TaxID=2823691 RepID=UPI0027E3D9B5|nr:NAD-binding protein [Streptomyces sp. AC512_CC834]
MLRRRDSFASNWKDDGQVSWLNSAGITLYRGQGRIGSDLVVEVTDDSGTARTIAARLAVIGGGVVASETATVFVALGSSVTTLARDGALPLAEPLAWKRGGDGEQFAHRTVTVAEVAVPRAQVLFVRGRGDVGAGEQFGVVEPDLEALLAH